MRMKVGDCIMMRHVYPKCPVIPEYLKTLENGLYPKGGVYAIVRVTTLPTPNSPPPSGFPNTEIKETWNHSYCEIKFERMGLMRDLSKTTKSYINVLQVNTINGFTEKQVDRKKDLWEKATITPAQVQAGGGIRNSKPNPNVNDPGWEDNQGES